MGHFRAARDLSVRNHPPDSRESFSFKSTLLHEAPAHLMPVAASLVSTGDEPIPSAGCCLPELLGKLVTLTAEHLCELFKQRKDLPTPVPIDRAHQLLLEMGISR